MTLNELMVGDWVNYKSPSSGKLRPIKIANIYGCEFNCEIENWNIISGKSISDTEPIKLTEEILVKNGFAYNKEQTEGDIQRVYYHFTKFYDFPLGRGFYIEYDTEDNIYWLTDHCWIRFKYVHQLQHLLRLCGIEKEIEL